jgi:hypothetical protein
MPLYPANLPPEAVRDFSLHKSTVNILCQAMREHLVPYKFTAGGQLNLAKVKRDYTDGVVAMPQALRCQVWWFKPTPTYVVYRE